MQIEKELIKIIPEKETVLTIGVFDGVHLGHQHLLNHLKDKAERNNRLSGVVTFKSHPQTVVHPSSELVWLDDLENRIDLLQKLGIDIIIALDFTRELSQLGAREYIQLLKDYLKMRGLVIGPDFALGKDRQGNTEQLYVLGQEMGFSVDVVEPVVLDDEVVSSSVIRQALALGDMKKVSKLLGRAFKLSGAIVSGDQRGRVLGFPTANLDVKAEQALPCDGVYATVVYMDHEPLPSVTNIGVRPTFGGGKRLVETYVLDYEGELREQRLSINFIDRLREEKYFGTAEELKEQIGKDVTQARIILDKPVQVKRV